MKSLVRAEVTKCLDFVQILARQQEASTCGAVFGRTVCEVIPKGTDKMMLNVWCRHQQLLHLLVVVLQT